MACKDDVIAGIDVISSEDLKKNKPKGTEQLGSLGFGPMKCRQLELWINKRRRRMTPPKSPLKEGTIKPTTTVDDCIGYSC
jgi:hypothetical protein